MITERQKKTHVILFLFTVVLLLAAQLFLRHAFKNACAELMTASGNLASLKNAVDSRYALFEKYRSFEIAAAAPGRASRVFPGDALELFTVVDRAMKDNDLEYVNRFSSSGTEPGGALQLQITFSGPYYGVLKALATLRGCEYVMRVADFRVTAGEDGEVSGSMTVLSNSRQS
jgi:hypothetical protein